MYKRRICYVDGDGGRTLWNGKTACSSNGMYYPRRVVVSDAREPRPEKAVEKVLQGVFHRTNASLDEIGKLASKVGMVASLDSKNRIRVRMAAP